MLHFSPLRNEATTVPLENNRHFYEGGGPVLGCTGSQKPSPLAGRTRVSLTSPPGLTLAPETERARPAATLTAGRDLRPSPGAEESSRDRVAGRPRLRAATRGMGLST